MEPLNSTWISTHTRIRLSIIFPPPFSASFRSVHFLHLPPLRFPQPVNSAYPVSGVSLNAYLLYSAVLNCAPVFLLSLSDCLSVRPFVRSPPSPLPCDKSAETQDCNSMSGLSPRTTIASSFLHYPCLLYPFFPSPNVPAFPEVCFFANRKRAIFCTRGSMLYYSFFSFPSGLCSFSGSRCHISRLSRLDRT